VSEVQASSVSRYSTLGVPYSKKPFEYNVENGEPIAEAETYLSRIARARKNYLPLWVYTPYLYAKLNHWNINPQASLLEVRLTDDYRFSKYLLLKAKAFSTTTSFNPKDSPLFSPSYSGINTYTKST